MHFSPALASASSAQTRGRAGKRAGCGARALHANVPPRRRRRSASFPCVCRRRRLLSFISKSLKSRRRRKERKEGRKRTARRDLASVANRTCNEAMSPLSYPSDPKKNNQTPCLLQTRKCCLYIHLLYLPRTPLTHSLTVHCTQRHPIIGEIPRRTAQNQPIGHNALSRNFPKAQKSKKNIPNPFFLLPLLASSGKQTKQRRPRRELPHDKYPNTNQSVTERLHACGNRLNLLCPPP
ncbi:hypothetical protein BS50DRAFT_100599 [Corynespora cassiicola Philippines]|uniref:Uncharacterized protein n=1 Tax=Corynespora cassiicola Philippines TaxID=1448308 RepID=A0A2T2NBV9_CORCC|nr:hypothetical protein BS50DRAFT_100599 [Corynespora cassiicola Philippines]